MRDGIWGSGCLSVVVVLVLVLGVCCEGCLEAGKRCDQNSSRWVNAPWVLPRGVPFPDLELDSGSGDQIG